MKVTVSFGNPLFVMFYTFASLGIGCAIGAHWRHTISLAAIFLLLHDAAIAILLAIAAIKVKSADGK
jgi:uncharacterized protein YhhL (DUF1145 family)